MFLQLLSCTRSEKEKFLEFEKLKLGKDPSTFANMLQFSSQDFHFTSKCRKYRESSSAQTTSTVLTSKVPPTTDANPLLTVNHLKHSQCSPLSQDTMTAWHRSTRKHFLETNITKLLLLTSKLEVRILSYCYSTSSKKMNSLTADILQL